MTARLQEAGATCLLRTSANSGHGLDTALSERIEETVDVFAFLFDQLGIDFRDASHLAPSDYSATETNMLVEMSRNSDWPHKAQEAQKSDPLAHSDPLAAVSLRTGCAATLSRRSPGK
jgi:hypothetical protein